VKNGHSDYCCDEMIQLGRSTAQQKQAGEKVPAQESLIRPLLYPPASEVQLFFFRINGYD
jgi:hypothetical protein